MLLSRCVIFQVYYTFVSLQLSTIQPDKYGDYFTDSELTLTEFK